MTLRVFTARVSYVGADRLDITRAGADAYRKRTGLTWEGEPWAPSWTIVWPIIKLRREVRDLGAYADSVLLAAWRAYVPAFTAEMRASYRHNRPAWDALLARESVTLCCTCTCADQCHRRLVARMLVACGAVDCGERPEKARRGA
mgnify:FL=1